MNNLFTELENQTKQTPLAEILRPKTIEDFLGQSNVISQKSPLLNLLLAESLLTQAIVEVVMREVMKEVMLTYLQPFQTVVLKLGLMVLQMVGSLQAQLAMEL